MPYYCTVPRCTSMAGKAKNVSFHQFPRDEELAILWNKILKRGKPYTKYSKVCSLHFRQEDYTINSVGKKGQWRSLRKDAVPSQNLPSESPVPQQRRSSCSQAQLPPSLMDPQIQQQFAHAIYVQTMMAMQAAGFRDNSEMAHLSVTQQDSRTGSESSYDPTPPPTPAIPATPATPLNLTPQGDLQNYLNTYSNINIQNEPYNSYKCPVCPKYFKDPDVFYLHSRSHENNKLSKEMLSSNPILANLLKPKSPSGMSEASARVSEVSARVSEASVQVSEVNGKNSFADRPSSMSENKRGLKAMSAMGIDKIAMALTMEAYVRNLSAYKEREEDIEDLNESEESNKLVIDEAT